MNKDNAAQYLPLVKALAEGKTIETRIGPNQWIEGSEDCEFEFRLSASEYRIKPEPLECWVVCCPQAKHPIFGCPIVSWGHETREAAEKEVAGRHDAGLLKIIHMREVIDR